MSAAELLSSLSTDAKAFLARIGRRFGTQQVQAQARQTLMAYANCSTELRLHGFGDRDRDRLAAALAAAAALERPEPKQTDRPYVRALNEAKNARARARSVLLSAYRRMRSSNEAGLAEAMDAMSSIVSETAEPGGDDHVYQLQLERLLAVLTMPAVRSAIAETGGPEAEAMLAEALDTLRRVDKDAPRRIDESGPSATRDADVLDGLIVELCRTAQFAAQSMAKEKGSGALAAEFRLAKLMADPTRQRG
jgi:hypothetical protein